MTLMQILIQLAVPLLWILWWAYWRIAARGVKQVRRRESVASRWGHILPLVIGGLLIALPRLPGWLGALLWTRTWTLYGIGVGVVAAGLGFSIWARKVLGRNWSGTVTLKEDHELIQSGPYRWIRHPIYTGILLGFIGSAIARDEWRGVLAVLIISVGLWRKLRLEERWMQELFGARYEEYRHRTWALVPWVI